MKVKAYCSVCKHTIGTWSLSGQEQSIEIHPCYNCMWEIYGKASAIIRKRMKKEKKA